MFPEILKQLNENEDKWDLMYVGQNASIQLFINVHREIVSNDRCISNLF